MRLQICLSTGDVAMMTPPKSSIGLAKWAEIHETVPDPRHFPWLYSGFGHGSDELKRKMGAMKRGIFGIALLANGAALFCIFNPWAENWADSGILFFAAEAGLLILIGVPVLIHHLRKGLSFGDALAAAFRSVLNFISGWV